MSDTALSDRIVELRRAIHREPEVGLDLRGTQAKVLADLADLPLEISTGRDLTSVTAVLRGGHAGPVVLLRGDMDALPVTERTGVDYASRLDGVMHACGHDLHTAMLAGAARLLSERVESLHGDVVFMFQPGEEGYDGAGAMIAEGILDAAGVRPVAAYGLHVTTKVPHGAFSTRPGGMLAASDRVKVEVRGAGGHGSAPHSARDPIPAACEIVVALQTMVTRRLNPFDPAVLTVGTFHAGTAANIIPDSAWFEATVRTFTATTQATIEAEVTRVAQAIAAGHGLEADVTYTHGYPATITDADETGFAAATVADLYGAERFVPMETPAFGAEDFSRVLQEVPGSFVLLGAAPADVDIEQAPYNHSPLAEFDDAVMGDGAALLAELAARRLATGAA